VGTGRKGKRKREGGRGSCSIPPHLPLSHERGKKKRRAVPWLPTMKRGKGKKKGEGGRQSSLATPRAMYFIVKHDIKGREKRRAPTGTPEGKERKGCVISPDSEQAIRGREVIC